MIATAERLFQPIGLPSIKEKLSSKASQVRSSVDRKFPYLIERKRSFVALMDACREKAKTLLSAFEAEGEKLTPQLAGEMLRERNAATYETLSHFRETGIQEDVRAVTEIKREDPLPVKLKKFLLKPKTLRVGAAFDIGLVVNTLSMAPIVGRFIGAGAAAGAVALDRGVLGLVARQFMDRRIGANEVRQYLEARYNERENENTPLAQWLSKDFRDREGEWQQGLTTSKALELSEALQFVKGRLENTLTFDTSEIRVHRHRIDGFEELRKLYKAEEALLAFILPRVSEDEQKDILGQSLRATQADPRKMIDFIADTPSRIKRKRNSDLKWAIPAAALSTLILGAGVSYGGAYAVEHASEIGFKLGQFKDWAIEQIKVSFFDGVDKKDFGNVAKYLAKKQAGEATVLDYYYMKHGVTPESFAERAKDVYRGMLADEIVPNIDRFKTDEYVSQFLERHNIQTTADMISFFDTRVASYVSQEDFLRYMYYINDRNPAYVGASFIDWNPPYSQGGHPVDLIEILYHLPYFDETLGTIVKFDYLLELENTFEGWEKLTNEQKKQVIDVIRLHGWIVSREDIEDLIKEVQASSARGSTEEQALASLPERTVPFDIERHNPQEISFNAGERGTISVQVDAYSFVPTLNQMPRLVAGSSELADKGIYLTFTGSPGVLDTEENIVIGLHTRLLRNRRSADTAGKFLDFVKKGDLFGLRDRIGRYEYIVTEMIRGIPEHDWSYAAATQDDTLTVFRCHITADGKLDLTKRDYWIAKPKEALMVAAA